MRDGNDCKHPIIRHKQGVFMSITPLLKDESLPVDSHFERRLKRGQRSTSLKENTQALVKKQSISFEKKSSFPDRHSKNIKAKRVENIAELRKIQECLMKNLTFSNGKIILQNEKIEFIIKKDLIISPKSKDQTTEFIYQRLLRAMTSQIYYFFDDEGYFVSLDTIDKLIKNRYGVVTTPFALEAQEELKTYYEDKTSLWGKEIESEVDYLELIQKLPPSKAIQKSKTEKEKLVISIYQKFYPVSKVTNAKALSTPQFAPITFLCSYEKLGLTKEDLFVHAVSSLKMSDAAIPYLQKLRILNFLRLFLACYLKRDEEITAPIIESIKAIREIAFKRDSAEFLDLVYEIDHLLRQKLTVPLLNLKAYPLKQILDVSHLFYEPLNGVKYTDFLNCLSTDLKFLAAQATVKVDPLNLFKDNKNGAFYSQIANFVVNQFIQLFEAEIVKCPDPKNIRQKLNHFSNVLIDLAYELVKKKKDYLTSFAIYSTLFIFELNQLMISDGNKGSFSKARKFGNTGSNENKFEKLKEIFSLSGNFLKVQEKMKKCQNLNLFFVPLFAPILTEFIHLIESLETEFKDVSKDIINNQKFHKISAKVWELSLMLQKVNNHLQKQPVDLHTNLDTYICQSHYSEDQLNEIYSKLKVILLNKKKLSSDTSP